MWKHRFVLLVVENEVHAINFSKKDTIYTKYVIIYTLNGGQIRVFLNDHQRFSTLSFHRVMHYGGKQETAME